ncbi:hypothetical protein Niako_5816 [Niastella koreensis GR20-10]|uniref:Uncharacterized protein n=1 Tax=Niastella koreensis (strain DSM 17620 / KACC 11465 / NBRC 106392 / GR20-10) TaxID=700598 RepID=G8TNW2_NIAKG|nr:hypothetical protein Niako_5816 [Niastella koreensis GR20-10]
MQHRLYRGFFISVSLLTYWFSVYNPYMSRTCLVYVPFLYRYGIYTGNQHNTYLSNKKRYISRYEAKPNLGYLIRDKYRSITSDLVELLKTASVL